MTLCTSIRLAALASFSFFIGCSTAQAAEPLAKGPSFYVGGTLGAAVVMPEGLKSTRKQDGDARESGGAFVGLRLATLPVADGWPLYLEVAYQDIARHTMRYQVQGSTSELTAEGHAISIATRVGVPLTDRFGLYAKLGTARSKVVGSTPTGQPAINVNGSGTGVVSGLGAEYQFDSGPVLRGELVGYSKVSPNTSAAAFTIGMGFRF